MFREILTEMGYPSSPKGVIKYLEDTTDWKVTKNTKGKVPSPYHFVTISNNKETIGIQFYKTYTKANFENGFGGKEIKVPFLKNVGVEKFVEALLKDVK